jgi:hypothetical protein
MRGLSSGATVTDFESSEAIRPARDDGQPMPTITVERLRADGPFRPGEKYVDDYLKGIVREAVPTGPRHVFVTVEVSDTDHEPPTASRR